MRQSSNPLGIAVRTLNCIQQQAVLSLFTRKCKKFQTPNVLVFLSFFLAKF